MTGLPCYFVLSSGKSHAFRRLPVVPRVGEYVMTRDGKTWRVTDVAYLLGDDEGYERVNVAIAEHDAGAGRESGGGR